MSVAVLRAENPHLLDSLVHCAAHAAHRCIDGPDKRWSSQRRISRSRGTRQLNGDLGGPFTQFLADLVSAGRAWPMIAAAIAVVVRVSMSLMTEDRIWARIAEIDEMEHDAEARQNKTTLRAAMNPTPEQLEAAEQADLDHADLLLERAALRRQLREKQQRRS